MHILVTGGSGFIGINIAQVLSQDSDNYVILYHGANHRIRRWKY